MSLVVNIPKLNSLAEKIKSFERDIYSLSDNAVSAANNVLNRTAASEYAPVNTAREKSYTCIRQAKTKMANVSNRLTKKSDELRNAAVSYRAQDRIDKVN